MFESWTREVERIAFSTIEQGHRVVALTSTGSGSGVSQLSEQFATIVAKSGKPVLLACFSRSSSPGLEGKLPWQPGDGRAASCIVQDARGFDRLTAEFDSSSRFLFNNVERMRSLLKLELAQYGAIIVDLPEVPARCEERLNGAAIAAACDTVLLVSLTGKVTQTALQDSIDVLKSAGVTLGGIVLNDRFSPTLGSEFAREARRLERYAPRLSKRLQALALSSRFLN